MEVVPVKACDCGAQMEPSERGWLCSSCGSVAPMTAAEEVAVWREWFAKNASHWEEIDDIEAELGRGEAFIPTVTLVGEANLNALVDSHVTIYLDDDGVPQCASRISAFDPNRKGGSW
jgi:hypothetical protein